MSEPFAFVLAQDRPLFDPGELYIMCKALELNARDCADEWGLPAPTVSLVDSVLKFPKGAHVHPLVITDNGGREGTLATHGWDGNRTFSRVYAQRGTGLREGRHSVMESAGHEVTEALVDPELNRWRPRPGHPGQLMALEVADMVQDTYPIKVSWRGESSTWQGANFVYQSYFDLGLAGGEELGTFWDGGGRFDHKGTLKRAGEIGPEGYAIVRERSADGEIEIKPIYGAQSDRAERHAALLHPMARTRRRGVLVDLEATA